MTPITLTRRRRRAFTLLELMLVVAIAGIMSVMAVATLQQTAQSSRERGAARGVSALIKRARSLAIQQHKMVLIEVNGNGLLLRACPARFGTNLCVGGAAAPVTAVDNGFINFGNEQESLGVTLASSAVLLFNVLGAPTVPGDAPFEYVVDHLGTTGDVTITVTAGGDVRVQ